MRFAVPFLAWFALGFLGIVAMAARLGIEDMRAVEGAPRVGDGVLLVLLVAQPSLLLALGVAVGVALSGKVGLRSWLVDRLRGDPPALISFQTVVGALALTTGVALLALLLDIGFHLAARESFMGLPGAEPALIPRLSALLYGGITEELMLRYGLMTAVAWLALKVFGERASRRRVLVMWAVILLVALAFGAGHLPALSESIEPNAVLVVRTVTINALLGTLYGWLYWRFTIEHAILAHAYTHGVFWLAGPLMTNVAGVG